METPLKTITLVNISTNSPYSIPTGPLYIAAVLEKAGYEVDFRDHAFTSPRDLDPANLLPSLADSADIVGVSCISDALPFAILALERFRAKYPSKTILLGGPGPSGVAGEILHHFPFIDIVVVGEGEATIVELMDCLNNGGTGDLQHVNGICFRQGGEVRRTPPRERIRDLDALPFPLYEKLQMEKYSLINIVFSRGCPYRCTFCDVAPMWQRKNYRRSIDSITEEIKYLRDKYGKSNFEFTDETFVLKKRDVLQFCSKLSSEGMDIKWACTGRVNLMSEELLAAMTSSGCQALFFGIESGSDSVLRDIHKDFTAREALDIILRAKDFARIVSSFIWGFPTETLADMTRTILLMSYLSQIGVDCRLNRLAPFALTPIYGEFKEQLLNPDKKSASSHTDPFQLWNYKKDIIDLVEKKPDVFPEFYWLPTEAMEEKIQMIESLHRHSHIMDFTWGESVKSLEG
jgi:anaerobic magnesium-protoporphyrin IX monomethyl ester cyclase